MIRRGTPLVAALALAALGWLAIPAYAQTCAGDCDGSGSVGINELVTCVNIALGSSPVSTCSACDVDGNGSVDISELVQAVNKALSSCGGGTAICGNGTMEADEECDDGNNFGGDGCAANCTTELRRATNLDPAGSIATVQLPAFPIVLNLTGMQALTAGSPRSEAVFGPGNVKLFEPGEFPIVTKVEDIQFDPIPILGQVCVCVRGVEVPEFGPGNAGSGKVGCGDQGLSDINVKVEADHDTTPGRAGNSGSANGLPDDPTCTAESTLGPGLVSHACLEGTGAACSAPENNHHGACNSPRVTTFSGGQGPRGSTLLISNTRMGLLNNFADDPCTATKNADNTCSAPDFGDDCLPCTDDDLKKGNPNIGVATSGTAEVFIYDVADTAGVRLGPGELCSGDPCIASVTGAPTDCDALAANPNGPLTGTLATAGPNIDAPMTGDSLTTTTLKAQNQ